MGQKSEIGMCTMISWIVAAVAGILVFMMAVNAVGVFLALLVALSVAVFLGLVLVNMFCGDTSEKIDEAIDSTTVSRADGVAKGGNDMNAGVGTKEAASAPASATFVSGDVAKAPVATAAIADTKAPTSKATNKASAKTKAVAKKAVAKKSVPKKATVKTAPAKPKTATKAKAAETAKEATLTGAAKKADTATKAVSKSSGKAETGKVATKTAAPKAKVSDADTSVAGKKPRLLKAARKAGADDLKRIKGVGPKLAQACNDMGVYHFDQVAAWNAAEVEWANENLPGAKGRVSRDGWVAQAKILASGGETEFSKRVDDGGVY